jgi:hypothetical protein
MNDSDKHENRVQEESILLYLYENPASVLNTYSLAQNLTQKPGQLAPEVFAAFQYAVETLISTGLINGTRYKGADLYYGEISLTKKGEVEAILQKRKAK